MENKLEYIKELKFFNSLKDEELNTLANISHITHHPKGSILYYENDTFDKIFFLVGGLLKVYKIDKYDNEIFLYNIYKNSLISELTKLEDNSIYCYSNTEFIEDSVILEIDFLKFKKYFLSKNILYSELINEMLLKTHELHCVINRELVFDASAKVAFMIKNDLEIFNTLKRQVVSFMLNIQPETLSRVLKKLKRSGIIDIENSKIKVIDEKSLTIIYQGE